MGWGQWELFSSLHRTLDQPGVVGVEVSFGAFFEGQCTKNVPLRWGKNHNNGCEVLKKFEMKGVVVGWDVCNLMRKQIRERW